MEGGVGGRENTFKKQTAQTTKQTRGFGGNSASYIYSGFFFKCLTILFMPLI